MDYELMLIDVKSPYYKDVLNLREEILRKPLGLTLSEDDIAEDQDQFILIALNDNKVLGCLFIKILTGDTVKLRQMAIALENQRNGLGSVLLHYTENFCLMNNYTHIELHARKEAIPFYKKNYYQETGVEFIEVGIPHKKMIKSLEPILL